MTRTSLQASLCLPTSVAGRPDWDTDAPSGSQGAKDLPIANFEYEDGGLRMIKGQPVQVVAGLFGWSGHVGRDRGRGPASADGCPHLPVSRRSLGGHGAGDGDHGRPGRLARVAHPPVDERRGPYLPALRLPHGGGETASVEHLPQMPRVRPIHPAQLKGPGFPGPWVYFFFLSGRWVIADAAAVFASFDAEELFNVLLAAVPAFLPVVSFLAMTCSRNTPPIAAPDDAPDRACAARSWIARPGRSLPFLHSGISDGGAQ
ncbi:hypothetical protein SAMN05660880_00285 [Luteibacter sp. 22Crub2.1]|nr:hypothetical protein SAMN05660880_00285 [Luteibacter sp. 22Crub2.1]